jgi:hypothetical protein
MLPGLFFAKSMRFVPRCNIALDRLAVQSEILKPIADAFRRNVNRIVATSVTPSLLAALSMYNTSMWCKAVHKVLGKPVVEPGDESALPQISAEFRLLSSSLSDVQKCAMLEAIKHNVDAYAAHSGLPFHSGLSSILAAQVISAWTAFETLAKDAWIAAVNVRPKLLGLQEAMVGKSIPLRKLHLHIFDLKNHMGDVLHDRFSFDSLEGTFEAYRSAFGKDVPFVSIFKNEMIDLVCQTRNVLVHRGGIVDRKYRDRVANIRRLTRVVVGTEVPLDGGIVAALTWITLRRAIELIKGIDQWLLDHQEPPA